MSTKATHAYSTTADFIHSESCESLRAQRDALLSATGEAEKHLACYVGNERVFSGATPALEALRAAIAQATRGQA